MWFIKLQVTVTASEATINLQNADEYDERTSIVFNLPWRTPKNIHPNIKMLPFTAFLYQYRRKKIYFVKSNSHGNKIYKNKNMMLKKFLTWACTQINMGCYLIVPRKNLPSSGKLFNYLYWKNRNKAKCFKFRFYYIILLLYYIYTPRASNHWKHLFIHTKNKQVHSNVIQLKKILYSIKH